MCEPHIDRSPPSLAPAQLAAPAELLLLQPVHTLPERMLLVWPLIASDCALSALPATAPEPPFSAPMWARRLWLPWLLRLLQVALSPFTLRPLPVPLLQLPLPLLQQLTSLFLRRPQRERMPADWLQLALLPPARLSADGQLLGWLPLACSPAGVMQAGSWLQQLLPAPVCAYSRLALLSVHHAAFSLPSAIPLHTLQLLLDNRALDSPRLLTTHALGFSLLQLLQLPASEAGWLSHHEAAMAPKTDMPEQLLPVCEAGWLSTRSAAIAANMDRQSWQDEA